MPSSSMTPEVYEQKRNELVTLLDEVIALLETTSVLEASRDKTKSELQGMRRKISENQFTIALMSHFQGGKSTTFNALCDGQEISPRGAMIKTSATVISAQHTLDDSKVGKAEIAWRSERELLSVFGERVLPHLREDAPERFSKCATVDQLAEIMNSQPDGEDERNDPFARNFAANIDLFKAALEKEWDACRKDRGGDSSDYIDPLRIGSLICWHYASDEMQKLRQTKELPVEEIADLVRFPKEWGERWDKCDPEEFRGKEPAFAFIREVRCKVRSENLARTGSVIVDCPGLLASRYDTDVARGILSTADAVWVLCPGSALGESELRIIKEVVKIRGDMPFFTINMSSTDRKNIADSIRPADIAYLRQQAGLEIGREEFRLYHALLALCAAQGEKLLSGELDGYSRTVLENLKPGKPIKKILSDTIKMQLMILDVPEMEEFDALDEAGVAIARSVSGIGDILLAIEKEVIRRKATSILVHNGAGRIEKEVRGFEGELKAFEDNFALTVEEAEKEYIKAKHVLETFQKSVKEEIERIHLNDDFIDQQLAKDYWEKVFEAAVRIASENAGTKIAGLKKRWLVFSPKEKDVANILLHEFRNEVEALGIRWQLDAQDGNNEVFTHFLKDRIDDLNRRMKEKWNLATEDASRLEALTEPEISVDLNMTPEHISNVRNARAAFDKADALKIGGFGVGTIAVSIAGFFVAGPFGVLIGPAVGGIIGLFIGQGKEQVKNSIVAKIGDSYREALRGNSAAIRKNLAEQLSAYRLNYRHEFLVLLKNQTINLESMKQKAMDEFKRKEWEREATALLCNETRVGKIEPIRRRLEVFQQSLIEFMPGEFEEVDCEPA